MRLLRPARVLTILALAGSVGCGNAEDGGDRETFSGSGYEFTVPEGWADQTDDAASIEGLGLDEPGVEGIDIDAVVAAEKVKGGSGKGKGSSGKGHDKGKGKGASDKGKGKGGSGMDKAGSGNGGGKSQTGEFRPNLTVVRTSEGIPAGTTALELAKANLRTSRQLGTLPEGAGGGSVSFSGSKVKKTKLDGEPAAYYEQVADSPVGEIRQRQIYAVRGGTAFGLTYGGLEAQQFKRNLPSLEKILDSWRWE